MNESQFFSMIKTILMQCLKYKVFVYSVFVGTALKTCLCPSFIAVISWQSVLLDEDTRVNIQYWSSVLKHLINMDEAMKLGQRQVFRAVPTNTEYTKTLYFKHCINIILKGTRGYGS
jgi:hypothetical protein